MLRTALFLADSGGQGRSAAQSMEKRYAVKVKGTRAGLRKEEDQIESVCCENKTAQAVALLMTYRWMRALCKLRHKYWPGVTSTAATRTSGRAKTFTTHTVDIPQIVREIIRFQSATHEEQEVSVSAQYQRLNRLILVQTHQSEHHPLRKHHRTLCAYPNQPN